MNLIDVNLLLYAVNPSVRQHETARQWIQQLFSSGAEVRLPWLVVIGFLRVSTRQGIFAMPLTPEEAMGYLEEWFELPNVSVLEDEPTHWPVFRQLQSHVGIAGNLTSDTYLASLAIALGATLYSADYDFHRYPGLNYINPLQ